MKIGPAWFPSRGRKDVLGESKTMAATTESELSCRHTRSLQNRCQNDSENPHGLRIRVPRHPAPLRGMIALEAVEVPIVGPMEAMCKQFGSILSHDLGLRR